MRKFTFLFAALCCATMANAEVMLLDSTVAVNEYGSKMKEAYTYDERGNKLTREDSRWYEHAPVWALDNRYEYTYDAHDSLLTETRYAWDEENNGWENISKDEYTYDENGHKQTHIVYKWNTYSGKWLENSKNEYTYDAQGNLTAENSYFWYANGSSWDPSRKSEHTYTNGKRTQTIISSWDSDLQTWKYYGKQEWTYDANGNQVDEVWYSWIANLSEWRNWKKWENTYDANGNLVEEIALDWNNTLGAWENTIKYAGTYDANGNVLTELSYSWNEETNAWDHEYMTEYTYNEYGYLSLAEEYEWDGYTSSWKLYQQITMYYHVWNEPEPVAKDLSGHFSVSATECVTFAQGNLRYKATTDQWCLANYQYDMIGAANANASSTYSGWIDLFGFGTSGVAAKPWEMTTASATYALPAQITTTIAGTDYDWLHYNTIVNDGSKEWRLMSKAEWDYLLNTRTNAASLQGQAVVNAIKGYILLPDNWACPTGLSFTPNPLNFTTNVYTFEQWEQMEAAGAVFLPGEGYRHETSFIGLKVGNGFYWTGDLCEYDDMAACVFFLSTEKMQTGVAMCCTGLSIRPVRKAWAEDIDQISNEQSAMSNKVIRNGMLLIERNGRTYNALGAEVK